MTMFREKAWGVVMKQLCADSVCSFPDGCGCRSAIESALVSAYNAGIEAAANVADQVLTDGRPSHTGKLARALKLPESST